MRALSHGFGTNETGSVSVEMALLSGIMILLTLGAVEAGYAYAQHSSAQNAVRHGARLAALTDPVSSSVERSGGSFDVSCSAATGACTTGSYSAAAMRRIVQGPDGDGTCAATQRERRGMCDVMKDLEMDHVSVRYVGGSSSSGERNRPPLVVVEIAERPLRTIVLGYAVPGRFRVLPSVSASTIGEDLDG